MRSGVVELDCADSAQVVHVSGELVVVGRFGKDTLADKLVCLVVEVVLQVVPKQKVQESGLAIFIPAERSSPVGSEQGSGIGKRGEAKQASSNRL